MPLYRAREQFFAGDMAESVQVDALYAADHPLVRQYPSLFEEVKVISKTGREVEAATAAPGEKRQVYRPEPEVEVEEPPVKRGPGRPPKSK